MSNRGTPEFTIEMSHPWLNEENIIFACKRACLILIVYLIGYFNGSIATLLLILCLWVFYDKSNEQNRLLEIPPPSCETSAENESVMKQSQNDLPAWVRYPDFQRCDWLNQIIAKFWPNITRHLNKTIKNQLDIYLEGLTFSLDEFGLGSKPPQIEGFKFYYENTRQDRLIIDVDVIYEGDCYAIIGTLVSRFEVKGIQLRGRIRFEMNSLLNKPPFIGAFAVSFVEMPVINFEIMSGILPFAEVFNLKSRVNTKMLAFLTEKLVFPNKFEIPLTGEAVTAHKECTGNDNQGEFNPNNYRKPTFNPFRIYGEVLGSLFRNLRKQREEARRLRRQKVDDLFRDFKTE